MCSSTSLMSLRRVVLSTWNKWQRRKKWYAVSGSNSHSQRGLMKSRKLCQIPLAPTFSDIHGAESVRIRSCSDPYFHTFGLNTDSTHLRIQSKCGKIRTRITLNTDTFYEAINFTKVKFDSLAHCLWKKLKIYIGTQPEGHTL